MQKDVFLGVDILLHVFVHIQMVRGYIGHHGHIRAFAHGNQLKAGKLHYDYVVFPNIKNIRQQCPANIAPQMNTFARCF